MHGDPESERQGVTARVVLECLQESLPTICSPGSIFVQDNASTHTAHLVQDWLVEWAEDNGVTLVDWPPHSPDLNPIENVWKLLKEAIMTARPDLVDMPKNNASKAALVATAVGCWEDLEKDVLQHLVETMNHRLTAVIAANGWYTKY